MGDKVTRKELVRLAPNMIDKFDGNPEELTSFIESVETVKEMVEVADNDFFVKLVVSRLEGDGRDAIEEEPNDIEHLIEQLRENIKLPSSKVIKGRMLALRTDKTNMSKFSERAEQLADELRRSLIIEGFSRAKAKGLVIEKTVTLCRKNARSDTVKAITITTTIVLTTEMDVTTTTTTVTKMEIEITTVETNIPFEL